MLEKLNLPAAKRLRQKTTVPPATGMKRKFASIGISSLPQLDAAILQQVRALGRYPKELYGPKTKEQKDERKLYYHIKYHCEELHDDTLAELKAWKEKDDYRWCCDLRSAKQQIEEWKQKLTCISSQSQHCYKELCRRIDLMLSDPSRAILLQERYLKAPPSTKKQEEAKRLML